MNNNDNITDYLTIKVITVFLRALLVARLYNKLNLKLELSNISSHPLGPPRIGLADFGQVEIVAK